LTAAMADSMSAWPVSSTRTVPGDWARMCDKKVTPSMRGMRWSETTMA
jgi:hypothetical protein